MWRVIGEIFENTLFEPIYSGKFDKVNTTNGPDYGEGSSRFGWPTTVDVTHQKFRTDIVRRLFLFKKKNVSTRIRGQLSR
jgi:hypothetical protein